MYFLRFTNNPQGDLERGYSFVGYQLFDTRDQAIAEFVELQGDDEELIAQDNITGMWGRRLSGLCGFGPFDSIEEALDSIGEYPNYNFGSPAVVFDGKECWDTSIDGRDDEGARFTPTSIVTINQ